MGESNPGVLGLSERDSYAFYALFEKDPELRKQAEARLRELGADPNSRGGMEGLVPPFHSSPADKWIPFSSPALPPRTASRAFPVRAVIPSIDEICSSGSVEQFSEAVADIVGDSLDIDPATGETAIYKGDGKYRPIRGWEHELPKLKLDDDGDPAFFGDGSGPNQEQARALWFLGLKEKSQRLGCCATHGQKVECSQHHAFSKTFFCGLRYCRTCGPRNFAKLFSKYIGLESVAVVRPGHVVAVLDFTLKNTGVLPEAKAVRLMGRRIRKVMKSLLGKRKDFGYLFCYEFGFNNENLHAHGVYWGPYLPQDKISDAWLAITGDSPVVWIQKAESFRAGLAHALKYTSKMPSDDPKRLAQLEQVFHGVRRVHTLGKFYNAKECQDSGEGKEEWLCPHCGQRLRASSVVRSLSELQAEGLRDVEERRIELRRMTQAYLEANSSP